jgi:hypothetical protein
MSELEELLEFCRAEARVCPTPQRWAELFKKITSSAGRSDIPPPLILAAWSHTSDSDKRERLALQLRYISDTGALTAIASSLSSLRRDEWVYWSERG